MNVFEAVKQSVTTRQAAEHYGIHVGRKEALNHAFDEPKQWEIREINEIMNQCISGWRYFPNPRMFSEYGRQKGWERENPATDSGNPSEKTMDGFVEVTEQMELPF